MIYAIHAIGSNCVKFGYTSGDVVSRMCNLQIGSPLELEILAVGEGDEYTEKSIHARLRHLLVRGEWFRLTDETLVIVKELKANTKPRRLKHISKERKELAAKENRRPGDWRSPLKVEWKEASGKEIEERPSAAFPRARATPKDLARRAEREAWWAAQETEETRKTNVHLQQCTAAIDYSASGAVVSKSNVVADQP